MADELRTVTVPGIGDLDFPASMKDDEVAAAIEKNYGPQMRAARNPEDVTAGMAFKGIPFVGGYVPKVEAAIRAVRGEGKGESWAERYANLVPEREAQYAQAEKESPILSGALQVAGGTAALAPLGATALGAKALGLTGRMATRIGAGGASGAGIGAGDAYMRGEDPGTGAMVGGAVGAAAAPVAGALGRLIRPAGAQDPARSAAQRALEAEGVELTAGQKVGGPAKWIEAQYGDITGANQEMLDRQARQYTGAAAAKAGINSDVLTPEVLDKAFEAWGKQRDKLASQTGLFGHGNILQAGGDLGQILSDYTRLTGVDQAASMPGKYLSRFVDLIQQNHGIPGDSFQALTSDMARSARMTANPGEQMVLNEMREKLFEAMERTAWGTPQEGMWKQMNGQYRNLLQLQAAMKNAKEGTALTGTLTPQDLYRGINSVDKKGYTRGRSDYEDMARAGLGLMKAPPSSGTAQRSYFTNVIPRAVIGGAAGAYGGEDPTSAIFGALAASVGPQVAGRMLMTKTGQKWLAGELGAQRYIQGIPGGAPFAPATGDVLRQ